MRIDLLVYRIALAACLLCLAVSCYWNYRIRCDVQRLAKEQLVANQKLNAARWKLVVSGYWCYQSGAGTAGSAILDLGTLPAPPPAAKEKK